MVCLGLFRFVRTGGMRGAVALPDTTTQRSRHRFEPDPVEQGRLRLVAGVISLWGYIGGDDDTVANDAIGRYTVHDNSCHALKLHSDIVIRAGDHLLVHGDANVLVMCYQEQNW